MYSFCPRFIGSLVKSIFPTLRKTQRINLSLGIFGLIKSQSGIMSEIVREVPGSVKHKHRLKRFWRFISNSRIKPEALRSLWVSWCMRKFTTGKCVVCAMDWTTLPGNIQCLMVAIPFMGRAIPLIWQILPICQLKDSQNRIEERLVSRLINLVPKGKKIVLTADRGFGRASLINFLKTKGVLFVIRIKSKIWIKIKKKKSILLKNLYLKKETPYWFPKIFLREDCSVEEVNLTGVVAKDSDDPWFLVTNLKNAERAIKTYKQRFDIEEWFKDMKHQLGISDLQTKDLKRVRRFIFLAAISFSLTALIGKPAKKIKEVMETLISNGKKSASIIWIAINAIKHKLLKQQFWKEIWVLGVMP